MSTSSGKIFVKVDTLSEQQENLKNSRKSFKILQKTVDKENLVGRKSTIFTKSKSETEIDDTDNVKRKKYVTHGCQTDLDRLALSQITEEDLTTPDEPSDGYWKVLAEQRRVALDLSLKENEELHERVNGLEDELNVSRAMLEETQNLVEILTELVQDDEKGESSSQSLINASLAEEATERNELKDDIVKKAIAGQDGDTAAATTVIKVTTKSSPKPPNNNPTSSSISPPHQH